MCRSLLQVRTAGAPGLGTRKGSSCRSCLTNVNNDSNKMLSRVQYACIRMEAKRSASSGKVRSEGGHEKEKEEGAFLG
jgi:hypothetical protein